MPKEKTTLQLPKQPTDWFEGCQDKYIIISLKHSKENETWFWKAGDLGYTPYFILAGVYSKRQVESRLMYYNDGMNTVAVPMAYSAFSAWGLQTTANFEQRAYWLNRSVPADSTPDVTNKGAE